MENKKIEKKIGAEHPNVARPYAIPYRNIPIIPFLPDALIGMNKVGNLAPTSIAKPMIIIMMPATNTSRDMEE